MSFLDFFSRSGKFSISGFLKTFRGKKSEFKKLNKDELDYLLRQGFFEPKFPLEMFIEYLVEIKWNFNEPLKEFSLPLNLACFHGNIKIFRKMIEAGADVHAKDAHLSGALDSACRSGNYNLVEYILSLNVEVNSRDDSNNSPIFYAVVNGHYNIFALLVEKGADINTRNKMGKTLLHSAVYSIETVEKLLELGADINAEDNFGKTVLDYAYWRNRDMMKKLIEFGASVAKFSQKSNFCWDQAIRFDDIDMIKLFIANGANLHSEDLNILFNINGGAEFDYRDDESEYCYDESDYKETSLNMIEYLLSLDQDINQQCPRSGKTSLMQTCINGTLEQVILLLNHGANPFLSDFDGRTALHYAAHGGNSDIISHLVNVCKMDPNIRSLNGQTPLHLIREYATSPVIIKTLIKLGADVNAQDNQKQTPLHIFTHTGYHNFVDLLLQHGARNDIFDINSKRPIDLCLQNTMVRKVYSKYSIYQFTALESIFLCLY